MARCKGCGREIIWIEMASGKAMPCDADRIPYNNNLQDGELSLITPDGKVARGDFDPASDIYGYVSHFVTCPVANKFKKGKEK